jgi:hypothetical protein
VSDPSDMYLIEPVTWIVLGVAFTLVIVTVVLWLRGVYGPGGDVEYAQWRRSDARRAADTRERIDTMRDRMGGAKLDGTAADTGAMRKATL